MTGNTSLGKCRHAYERLILCACWNCIQNPWVYYLCTYYTIPFKVLKMLASYLHFINTCTFNTFGTDIVQTLPRWLLFLLKLYNMLHFNFLHNFQMLKTFSNFCVSWNNKKKYVKICSHFTILNEIPVNYFHKLEKSNIFFIFTKYDVILTS